LIKQLVNAFSFHLVLFSSTAFNGEFPMAIFFHGITGKAFEAFMHGDFSGEKKNEIVSPWVCSESDGFTYLHSLEHSIEEYDDDYAEYSAIQSAFESAVIQSAMNADNCAYVIQFDFDPDSVEVDYSCENMEHCRRIESSRIKPENIVKVYKMELNPEFHLFRLLPVFGNTYFNTYALTPEKKQALKTLSRVDCYSVCEQLTDEINGNWVEFNFKQETEK
jgi:hypothetical protein